MGDSDKKKSNFGEIRERDATGHRTGLGTMARNPIDTVKALTGFSKEYSDMREKNIRGGNLPAHEKANYEATKATGKPEVAAAVSAAREQFKNFRSFSGDQRSDKERADTMAANQAGRDRAVAEMKASASGGSGGGAGGGGGGDGGKDCVIF